VVAEERRIDFERLVVEGDGVVVAGKGRVRVRGRKADFSTSPFDFAQGPGRNDRIMSGCGIFFMGQFTMRVWLLTFLVRR